MAATQAFVTHLIGGFGAWDQLLLWNRGGVWQSSEQPHSRLEHVRALVEGGFPVIPHGE